MPDITLQEILQNQNNFINARTAEINQLNTNVSSALKALNELANSEYSYTHTPVIMNSLEADYNSIISADSSLSSYSAVGIRAELKHGETIYKHGNRLFINGTEAESDYSFSGINSNGGTEIINVWYFENNGKLELNTQCDFNIVEVQILCKSAQPTVDVSYYKYADEIKCEAFAITATDTRARKFVSNGFTELAQVIPDDVTHFESNATTILASNREIAAKYNLKYLYLPNLREIPAALGTNYKPVFGKGSFNPSATKYNVIIDFPNLETVNNAYSNESNAVFNGIHTVTLPESVQYIGRKCFDNNHTVNLNCKNATTIANDLFINAPTIFNVCADWSASINISVAAQNWLLENYIDLFENKLRNMGSETRNITIPSAVLAELDESVVTAVTAKGWTLGGA